MRLITQCRIPRHHFLFGKDNFLLLHLNQLIVMGKGDKRSKRGKIHIGSTGVTRPKKKKAAKKSAAKAAPKKAAAKKAAPKKAAKKAE
jgi:ribosomal small subunit protein bTHX